MGTSNTASSGLLFIYFIVWLIMYVVFALGMYGSFQKAGQPGWAAFVPIYNFIIMLKIAGRPVTWAWFLLLAIIPFFGGIALLVIYIIVLNDISVSFGHGGGFTVGLVLLGPIFWYILWLGQSQYRGPAALARAGGFPGQYPPPGYPPQPGYPQPGQQYQQPGQQYQQPGQQYPQQGQQYPQQGQQYPQQGQQPGQQYPQPGQQYPQPGQQYPQPGQQYPQPGQEYPQPGQEYPRPPESP